MAGRLFVVATPLGNLEDASPRALAVLRAVELIACEDTRRTAKLLARHGIERPTVSCHRFNESARATTILRRLDEGQDVALVSDGGTPGISDPGARLVRDALDAGIEVLPLPGPSAVTALLSASGLDADRFVFDGFLPHRGGQRRRRLRELRRETRTVVLFEAPHRLRDTLRDLGEILGERRVVLGRELTKLHETVLAGTPRELSGKLSDPIRGEITLAVAGAAEGDLDRDEEQAQRVLGAWRAALDAHPGDRRAALRAAAAELGLGRAELYRLLAELGREAPSR